MSLARACRAMYLATLLLLPWSWFPPFPWLHEHAQWSDVTFAVAFALWIINLWKTNRRPSFGAAHAAIALYFAAAAFSFLFASPNLQGALKLLGIGELCLIAVMTSDLAGEARAKRAIARTIAVTTLFVAAAAVLGLALFYAGVITPLIGTYGDLVQSDMYARVQAGLYHPNLLASFYIFAATTIRQGEEELSPLLRRASLAALWATVALTFSRGVLGFILAAVIARARTGARRLFAASLGALFVVAIIFLTFYKVSLDPSRPRSFHVEGAGNSPRAQAFRSSAASLASHPLAGTGPGTHPGRYLNSPFDSHMTFLNIASTLGLPALIAFTALIALLWRKRVRPTSLILWGGLAGLALDALAQDVEDFRHIWVLIGIILATSTEKREQAPAAGTAST